MAPAKMILQTVLACLLKTNARKSPIFAFGLFLGCESELTPPTSEAVSLIDVHAWHLVAVSEDPFDDRPETSSCPATGYGVEDGFFK